MQGTMNESILKLHQQLRRIKDESGRNITDQFKKLPSKEEDAEYYHLVPRPISFLMIRNRIDKQKYVSATQWVSDVELLIKNAKILSSRITPQLGVDLDMMQKFLNDHVKPKILTEGHGAASKSMPTPAPFERSADELEQDNDDAEGSSFPPNANPTGPAAGLSQTLFPQIKFLHTFTYSGQSYTNGDCLYLPNPDDSAHALVSRITRLWKCNNYYGIVSALLLKPTYLPRETMAMQPSVLENELYASSVFRVHFAHEILGKCHVKYISKEIEVPPKSPSDHEHSYVCRYYFDVPRLRFYPFNLANSYVPSLQQSLENRKNFKGDTRKVFCTYLPSCGRFFHSLDVLQKHATDHIFQMPQFTADAGKYLPGTHLPKRAAAKSSYSTHATHEPGSLSSPAHAAPTPITKPTLKQVHVHQDYPIKYPTLHATTPSPQEIPKEIVSLFETDKNGNVLWFSSPPLDVPAGDMPIHSLDYISFKSSQLQS